jgi:hypothetical protein
VGEATTAAVWQQQQQLVQLEILHMVGLVVKQELALLVTLQAVVAVVEDSFIIIQQVQVVMRAY